MATRSRPIPLPRLPVARRPAIPSTDASELAAIARRTGAIRVILVLLLLGLLAAAFVAARRLDVRQGAFVPVGTSTIVVLDLSTSVSAESNRRIARVLQTIVESDQRVGLVAFSDTAYELVPPGTPGTELRPILRYFTPQRIDRRQRRLLDLFGRSANTPEGQFIVNPWLRSFRAGTRISAGLRVARGMLERDGIDKGSVLLISDLDYSPFDFGSLTYELLQYKDRDLPLRIVALFPNVFNREVFRRLLGGDAFIDPVSLDVGAGHTGRANLAGPTPTALLVAGALLLVLLTVNELACARLRWSRSGRPL